MKIYYTGQPLRNADYLALMRGRHVMFSYLSRRRSVWDDLTPFAGAVLDSGAYSVWRRGATVDIGEYADYCATREDDLDWYANLDSITDWKKTLRNQAELERRGLSPVPVFHLGEPWALLDDLVYSYSRVAIGRGQKVPFALLTTMLEFVFDRYSAPRDAARRLEARGVRREGDEGARRPATVAAVSAPLRAGRAPFVKFHGFRMTDRRLIARFPFDSVDSTTWNAGVAYGELPTDDGRASKRATVADLGFSYLTDTTRARVWLDFFTAAPKAHAFTRRKRTRANQSLVAPRGGQNAR
jgi:hypothetical protein